MTNYDEIKSIILNKDIDALKKWINNGGNAKMIIGDGGYKESLINYIIDEIEDEDGESIYLQMLEIVIENGADVNYCYEAYNAPVFQALSLKNSKVLKLLLENGANVNIVGERSETVLMRAAIDQNLELMSLLLPYANEDIINKSGSHWAWPPLGLAFYHKNLEMIELLLRYKADPFAIDGEGYLTIENIPKDIDEGLKKQIFDLIEKYKVE
jgi:hypothetical protein